MDFTGERYIPEVHGNIELEHMHRYLLASQIAMGKDILDIACGEGYGTALLAGKAKNITGVDISAETINHARKKYAKENINFMVGSCTEIPLPDKSIDLVVSFETIEHLEEHDLMMKEIKRVMRSNGVLLISSPDKYYYSVEPGYHNPFHKKELYQHEFRQLIEEYFKNTLYFEQRVIYGSMVLSNSFPTLTMSYFKENETIKSANGIIRPTYWIALASDADLPELMTGIYECPINESEIVREWTKVVETRDETIATLQSQIAEHAQLIETLRSQLTEKEKTLQDLGQQVASKDEAIAMLQAQIAEHAQLIETLRSQLTEKEQALQDLGQQVASKDETIASLQAQTAEHAQLIETSRSQLAEKEKTLQDLGQQVASKDEAIASLQAQIAEHENSIQSLNTQLENCDQQIQILNREIALYTSSTSWHITRPFRKVTKKFRGGKNA